MGCRWKIGDGTTIRVWGMPWLNRDSDFFVRTPMLPGWEAVLVSDLFVPGTRVWNMELINWIFTEEDRDAILKTTPGMGDAGDRLIWHYTRNGVYSVKSAYSLGMQLVGEGNEAGHAAWKIIWKIKCSPRAKHCLWRFARGFVPVNTRLRRIGVDVPQLCSLCAAATETIWHLTVDCPYSRSCWSRMEILDCMDRLSLKVDNAQGLILSLVEELSQEQLILFAKVLWRIWHYRNDKIWNGRGSTPDQALKSATCILEEWRMVHHPVRGGRSMPCCDKWRKPNPGFIKANIDASFFEHMGLTGAVIFVRDEEGEFVLGRTLTRQGLLSVDEGEAWALLQTLTWLSDLGFEKVELEVDSSNLNNALKKMDIDFSVFGDYVTACKGVLSQHPHFSVRWVYRNANLLAHSLARASWNYDSPYIWVEPPDFVDGLLESICSCIN
ncbi:hypothetical protein ACS0TY_008219 [Phlomoides rotata]